MQMFELHAKWDIFRIGLAGIACFIGFPCTYTPKNNANRIAALTIFFGSSLFAIFLVTFVLKFTQSPILDPQTKTFDELIENDYELIGNEFVFQKIWNQHEV